MELQYAELAEWIHPELFVLIPLLYLAGNALKKSPLRDWLIPYVLCAAAVFLSAVYLLGKGFDACGGVWQLMFSACTQGALCTACSVYAKNLVKQYRERS